MVSAQGGAVEPGARPDINVAEGVESSAPQSRVSADCANCETAAALRRQLERTDVLLSLAEAERQEWEKEYVNIAASYSQLRQDFAAVQASRAYRYALRLKRIVPRRRRV